MMQPPHIAPNLSWQLPTLLDLEGPGMTDEGQNFHVYRDNDQTSSGASDSFEHISGTHQSVRPQLPHSSIYGSITIII